MDSEDSLRSFKTLVSYESPQGQAPVEDQEVFMYDPEEAAKMKRENRQMTVDRIAAEHEDMWVKQSMAYAQQVR